MQQTSPSSSKLLKKPLVVVLRGCTQSAETIAEQSGWDKLAEKNNFYVLYPQQKLINILIYVLIGLILVILVKMVAKPIQFMP